MAQPAGVQGSRKKPADSDRNPGPTGPRTMVHPPHLNELHRLVEQLVEVEDDRARERLLLETIERVGWAQAAALFRRTGAASTWIPVLSRGPADLLPDAGLVEAIGIGAFPPELPLSGTVLFAGEEGQRTALALGGVAHQESVDQLEALLEVLVQLSPARSPADSSELSILHAPLPDEARPHGARPDGETEDTEPLGEDDRDRAA